jgi:hypothetical protein
MTIFDDQALMQAVSEKYRRLDAGESVEFTKEEAELAGAFVEDAIRLEDVDHPEIGGHHHDE